MANVYVKDIETREIVDTIETTMTGSSLERMLMGLMRNMDLERFYVDDSECDNE